jgi:hypothetical protein
MATTSFFKRLLNSGGRPTAESGQCRLTLAAFGKHPGWNDHIPGIGVETEALAHVKHALYVSGVGGRIDTGAWKSLETEKRLEGFDHTFLWLRSGHVIMGRLYSSEDGLHRKEYPMVLCVDGEGVTSEFILTRVQPELGRLRDACQATSSAEQVTVECRMTQDRLRTLATSFAPGAPDVVASPDARQRFLAHRELGPERIGFLRILHELGAAGERSGAGANVRSRHLRLPLAADFRESAILMWAEFLQCLEAASVPLLLISRTGVEWLDVIIGEPVSDDFFCLQASLKALPLASQIPYDLNPELRIRLQKMEAKFLRVETLAGITLPGAAPTKVMPASGVVRATAKTAAAPKNFNWLITLTGIIGLLSLMLGAWLFSGIRAPAPETTSPATSSNSPPPKAQVATLPPEEARNINEPAGETARLKTQAAERTKDAKMPVEDAKVQAKARDSDADLAQIALAQGSYDQALEISRKWPEADRFKAILVRIAAETNQLFQITEHLKVGNYAPIFALTNQLPDNPKFKEVIARADGERRLLDGAKAEFARGDYTFLQRQELQALKAKPPFQSLFQAGGVEADQLKQAQLLRAENKPQAARDFIAQSNVNKPPFADILKWATTELERATVQQRDLQSAEGYFNQGDYPAAAELCKKYPEIAAFTVLATSIGVEQGALADAQKKLAAGNYSFAGELAGRPYKTKPPVATLLRKADEEQMALGELEKLKQRGDWQALPGELNKLSPEVAGKKPFDDLRQWAIGKAQDDEDRRKGDPSRLDTEFEVLLVRFNLLKPKDAKMPEAKNEKAMDGFLDVAGKEYYLGRVKVLRSEYAKGGWLEQNDRRRNLKKLEETVQNY